MNVQHRSVALGAAVLVAASMVGCGTSLPPEFPLSEAPVIAAVQVSSLTIPAEARRQVAEMLKAHFGTPAAPVLVPASAAERAGVDTSRLVEGGELYRRHCMHCHGLAGDGKGPTAPFLFPKPRDYRGGIFKFTSTARSGPAKPTRDDLRQTLEWGIVGTAMPAFNLLDSEQLEAIVDYVIFLSMRGEVELLLLQAYSDDGELDADRAEVELDYVAGMWGDAASKVIVPDVPEPEFTLASVERGKQLYQSAQAQCSACHGMTGKGDGPSAEVNPETGQPLLDDWGEKVPPANLTLGFYRGGRRPIDLYRRIYAGIEGTPMPELYRAFTDPVDLWHVVHFVQALPYLNLSEPPTAGADEQAAGH